MPEAVANIFGGSPTSKSLVHVSADSGHNRILELSETLKSMQVQLADAVDAVTSIHVQTDEARAPEESSSREGIDSARISQTRAGANFRRKEVQFGGLMTSSLSSQYFRSQDSGLHA